ncbi:uncharacterized protein PV09_07608 [Verruconis gallopava]|uniref:Heterokaryon incompatibility domain-containing protein n=1 Tax=Verruconis gallopava TaxID=253628 RepID=A0A0D2A255_9PEZI|nr:uncharacterized protein PV09_07608 [Verruconis gallopava]KIW00848.1 hypothetical protein PV09_07608 [Verruconis gallopava]
MASFVHQALDLDRTQIRLVRLLPSRDYSVSCEVHVFDFNDCPPYEALSYVWGSDLETATIELNGRPYEVRENLWWFLEHARMNNCSVDEHDVHLRRFGWLWIDQLCIDQNFPAEKNQQVQMMSRIFENAKRAIVWLGPEEHDSDRALSVIMLAASLFSGDPYELSSMEKRQVCEFFHSDGICNVRARQSVIAMFERPYWTRIWTVQEFLRAGELLIMCGNHAIFWVELAIFYRLYRFFIDCMISKDPKYALTKSIFGPADRYIEHKFNAVWPASAVCKNTDFPHSCWQGYLYPPQWPLDSVLFSFSHLNCGDIRDKIFGLLGIVKEQDRIIVDYDQAPRTVFSMAMSVMRGRGQAYPDRSAFYRLGTIMGATLKELSDCEFFTSKELVNAGRKRKLSNDIATFAKRLMGNGVPTLAVP